MLRLLTALALTSLAFGQSPELDGTGTGNLNGTFVFRHLVFDSFNAQGRGTGARAEYGTIDFDGSGRYSVSGTFIDSTVSNGQPRSLSVTGTYRIGASGFGYVANPAAPQSEGERIYGAFAQGIFAGTATEGDLVDIFVAIPLAAATRNTHFASDYWAASIDFPGANEAAIKNAQFRLIPDGTGNLAPIEFSGRAADRNPPAHTQTASGATYDFDGSSGTLTVPVPNGIAANRALLAGTRTIYLSTNRDFLLGFSPEGYDILFGVRALDQPPTSSIFQGTYFLAALEADIHEQGISSFYGSEIDAFGDGHSVMHQRVASNRFPSWDYIIDNHTTLAEDGTDANFNGYRVAFGNQGRAFVAVHDGAYSFLIGVRSTEMPVGDPVMLHPLGVLNAASYAPITTPIAPGELLSLHGANLARTRRVVPGGQRFPDTLEGVRVLINGIASPIYAVSPTQVVAVVPYSLRHEGHPVATVQVENNGVRSNTVTMFVTDVMPGYFTQGPNGRSFAIALRPDGSLATPENPAQPGEILTVFLTGLGAVTPEIGDGAVPPTDPSRLHRAAVFVNQQMDVYSIQPTAIFNFARAQYAGLVPGFAGLYQLNVQMPLRAGPGDEVHIEIITGHTASRQLWVPVAATSSNTQ